VANRMPNRFSCRTVKVCAAQTRTIRIRRKGQTLAGNKVRVSDGGAGNENTAVNVPLNV
jgi:hypothetical protein